MNLMRILWDERTMNSDWSVRNQKTEFLSLIIFNHPQSPRRWPSTRSWSYYTLVKIGREPFHVRCDMWRNDWWCCSESQRRTWRNLIWRRRRLCNSLRGWREVVHVGLLDEEKDGNHSWIPWMKRSSDSRRETLRRVPDFPTSLFLILKSPLSLLFEKRQWCELNVLPDQLSEPRSNWVYSASSIGQQRALQNRSSSTLP